ncbi:MAG TPA: hypothetical protein PLU52_03060 [Opitutaceae bacterium]|nr:hypothetical protein [Opitutaceae bacterium]HND59987.1 hypothetical protein [Opitutaceae bacterium]
MVPLVAGAALPSEEVWRARDLLGPDTWAEVLQIENRNPSSAHPAAMDALVFEQGGILWFYTPGEGTQSLSLYRNHAEADKADLAPLLAAIDPAFVGHRVIPEAERPLQLGAAGPLSNACFIECIARWRTKVARGDPASHPRLLSCYAETEAGLRGHTVLVYETEDGLEVLDPAARRPKRYPRSWRENPMALAASVLTDEKVVKARWVTVDGAPTTQLARAGSTFRWREVGTAHLAPE